MRVSAIWAVGGGAAAPRARPRPDRLDADRRARRGRPHARREDLLMAAHRGPDDIAIIGWNISPMVRRTGKSETQMLLEVVTGACADAGITRKRGRLHLRRQLRLRGRAGLLLRAEHRRHRRVAAQPRLARRDGRRLGAVRGVGPPAAGRHRHRGRHGFGPLVDGRPGAALPDGDGPVLPGAARRRCRSASPRCRPGRSWRPARSPSARWPRSRCGPGDDAKVNPHAQVTRRLRRRRPAGRGPRPPPLAPSRPAADHRRRLRRRDRTGRRGASGCAEHPVWIRGIAHCAELHYPGMRDLCVSESASARPRPPASATGRSRWPRSRRPSPTRSRSSSRPSGSDPTWRSTRRGRAGRQPGHGDRPGPDRRGGRPDPRPRAPPHPGHSTSGPCLQQNLVCILEGD